MYLITQSLLGAWGYTFNCHEDYQEEAYADFLTVLRREKKEATPEMQNGLEFESLCYQIADGLYVPDEKPHKWASGASAVATRIKGSQYQVKASRELSVAGFDLLVYGILDALKAGSIYDVKFLNKSFSSVELAGKYLESPQHPTYFYLVPEALDFTYLVSDGQELYTERYTPADTRPLESIVEEFFASLKSMGLLDLYKEYWLAR